MFKRLKLLSIRELKRLREEEERAGKISTPYYKYICDRIHEEDIKNILKLNDRADLLSHATV